MVIRKININDLDQLTKIHHDHYQNEFEFPKGHFLDSYAVIDDNNKIITAGGVRTIAESVILTDKDRSVRDRREALLLMLNMSVLCCNLNGYDQLHAFVKDANWERVLEKYNFKICQNRAYYLQVL